jgi:hypothetical protein
MNRLLEWLLHPHRGEQRVAERPADDETPVFFRRVAEPDARYLVETQAAVHIDRARMERALEGPRYRLPDAARTPEEICSFLDSLAKDVK